MESEIEKHLNRRVAQAGGLCVKVPPLFYAGFPDRLVLLPRAVVIFVELKDTGKKPRGLQKLVHARLRSLGFRVEVLDSKGSIDAFMLST